MPSVREWAQLKRQQGAPDDVVAKALVKLGAVTQDGRPVDAVLDGDVDTAKAAWRAQKASQAPSRGIQSAPPVTIRKPATAPPGERVEEVTFPPMVLGGRPLTEEDRALVEGLPAVAAGRVMDIADPRERARAVDALRLAERAAVDIADPEAVERIVPPGVENVPAPEPAGGRHIARRLVAPAVRVPGMAAGVVTGLGETAAGVAGEALGFKPVEEELAKRQRQEAAALGERPVSPEREQGAAQAYTLTEEDLRARLAASRALEKLPQKEDRTAVERFAATPLTSTAAFGKDLFSDLVDNMAAILNLVGEAAGARTSEEEIGRGTFLESMQQQFGAGQEVGEMLAGGAVGGTAALLANLPQAAETRPFTTAMMLWPLLRALPTERLTPGLAALKRKVGAVATAAGERIGADKLSALAAKYLLPRMKRVPMADRLAHLKRWVSDRIQQPDADTTILVSRMLEDPETLAAEVEAGFAELAREAERGTITAAEIHAPAARKPSLEVKGEGVPIEEQIRAIEEERAPRPPSAQGPTPGTVDVRAAATAAHAVAGIPKAFDRFLALEGVWRKAATHEAPAVLEAVAKTRAQMVAVRDKLAGEVKGAETLLRRLDALDDRGPSAVAERDAFAAKHGGTLARLPAKRAQLDAFDQAIGRATEIVEGPDVVPRAGGETELRRTEIPVEFVKGRARQPAEVMEMEAALMRRPEGGPSPKELVQRKLFTPDEVERFSPPSRVEALAQALLPETRTPIDVQPVLDHPRVRAVVEGIVKGMKGIYRQADLIEGKGGEEILGIRQIELARRGTAFIPDEEALRIVTSAFRDDSVQRLRSPKAREEIVARIRKKHPELSEEGLQASLLRMADSHLLDQAFNYNIALESGARVNLFQEMLDTFKDKPEILREVVSEATRQIGVTVAADVTKGRLAAGMVEEIERFGMHNQDLPEVVQNIARGVLIEGQAPPQILNRFTAKDIATRLDAVKERVIDDVAAARRISRTKAARKVEALISRFNNTFTRASPALKDRFPQAAEAITFLKAQAGVERAQGTYGVTQVAEGFNDAASWYFEAADQARQEVGLLGALGKNMRAGLTAGNLSAHINNFSSNTGIQGLRRGVTPLGVWRQLAQTKWLWEQYRQGKLASQPRLERLLRGIERSRIMDTDIVDAEFATMNDPSFTQAGWRRKITEPLRKLNAAMLKAYKFGDSVFKVDEAVRNGQELWTRIDVLGDGKHLDLRTSPRRWVRVRKYGQHFTLEERGVGQAPGRALPIPVERLDQAVANAAGVPGTNLFFNMKDVPNWLLLLRAGHFGGFASPFLTWAWKSLDIPGLKRGLLTEVMTGDAGVYTPTNDPAIWALQARASAAVAVRRALVMNALRAEFLERDERALREVFRWLPSDVGLVLLDEGTNPGYVGFKDWNSANWAGSTEALFRLGTAAFVAANPDMTADKLYGFDPETGDWEDDADLAKYPAAHQEDVRKRRALWKKHHTGELWAPADAIQLAGLAGHPLIQLVADVNEAERRGRAVSGADIARNYGVLLMGGLLHRVADVSISAADPYSPLSSRSFAIEEDPEETEEHVRWAVRRITSLGGRTREIERTGRDYFRRLKTAFRASLLKDKQNRLKAMERAEEDSESMDALSRQVDFLSGIIDDEIDDEQDHFDEVVEKVTGRQEKRRAETPAQEARP